MMFVLGDLFRDDFAADFAAISSNPVKKNCLFIQVAIYLPLTNNVYFRRDQANHQICPRAKEE